MLTLFSCRVIFLGNSNVALMSEDEFADLRLTSSINSFRFVVFVLNSCMLHVVKLGRMPIFRFVSFVEALPLVRCSQKPLKH
jgi:hypothetical protein